MMISFFIILVILYASAAASPFVTGPAGYLKNIDFVFKGYDIMLGNPLPVDAASDPGFKQPIFDMAYTKTQDPGSEYMEPVGITISDCSGSCHGASSVVTISTSSAYQTTLSKITTHTRHSWFNAFSSSQSYKNLHSETETGESVFTIENGICCTFELDMESNGAKLTDHFLAWINHLPEEYDQDTYEQFTQAFGTHYLTHLQMGAIYAYQKQYKTETWNTMTQTQKQSASKWDVAVLGVGSGGSSSSGSSSNSANQESDTAQRTDTISIGAAPQGDLSQWMNAAKATPMPVSSILKPISDLLLPSWQTPDGFYGDVSSSHLAAVRKNLEVFNNYYASTGVTGTNEPNPNELTTGDLDAGGWGGSCTCPDGSVYYVGDEKSDCDHIACEGGFSGTCNKWIGKWAYRRVVCNAKINTVTKGAPNTGVTWGGTCTCPDGTAYWANNINPTCDNLACHAGMSGTCVQNDVPVQNTQVTCRPYGDTILDNQASIGGWGGKCICPSGGIYWVGDNNNKCESLACVGGTPGTCNQKNGKWSNRKVICNSAGGTTSGAATYCEKCPMGQCDRENSLCKIYSDGLHCKLKPSQSCEYTNCYTVGSDTYFKWKPQSTNLAEIPCFGLAAPPRCDTLNEADCDTYVSCTYNNGQCVITGQAGSVGASESVQTLVKQAALQEGSVGAPESEQSLDLSAEMVTFDPIDNPFVKFFACVGLLAVLIELYRSTRCCQKKDTYREVVSPEI